MYRTDEAGLVVDEDGHPVATPVDTFVTGLGVEAESEIIILRLHRFGERGCGDPIPAGKIHQFSLSARRAKALAHELLAYAAQVEKEGSQPRQH